MVFIAGSRLYMMDVRLPDSKHPKLAGPRGPGAEQYSLNPYIEPDRHQDHLQLPPLHHPSSRTPEPPHCPSTSNRHDASYSPHQPLFEPSGQSHPWLSTQSSISAVNLYNNSYGRTELQTPGQDANLHPSLSYPAPIQQPDTRKKAQRATQACGMCRTLKAKCDEGRPLCTNCKEKGNECRYRDPPPKQQDKTTEMMEMLKEILKRLKHLEEQVANMERSPMQLAISDPRIKQEVDEGERIPVGGYRRPSAASRSQHLPSIELPYSSAILVEPEEEASEEEEESGDLGPPKAPSIPVNHTTGAARLLLVGPIAEMVNPILKSLKIGGENYPIAKERRRGLLRLYGRGEGYDASPDRDPLTDHTDSTPGDTPSNVSSPAVGEEWGQLGGLTPPANPGHPLQEITGREIGAEGMPDFSRATVWELVKSYNDNINVMHPILVPGQLNALVEQFLKSILESHAQPKQPTQAAVGYPGLRATSNCMNPESLGNKRKRHPALGDYPDVEPFTLKHKPGHPYRSIRSALVLLVMALGKLSQTRGEIDYLEKEPTIQNGHPSSPLQSSPTLSTPMGSRRTSLASGWAFKGTSGLKMKNLDVIPGLAYFALATDILGNQLAGNSLQHVHANILAGLYHGQLGRVMESYGYIATACRSIQVILRPKLDHFKRVKAAVSVSPGEDNPLLFAFWTCLQLESDIVAELPCPHSGILTYEEDMPDPNVQYAVETDKFDPMVIQSYTAQLFLRKQLNQLHKMFYKPDVKENQFPEVVVRKPEDHFPTIKAYQTNLDQITSYAPNMIWDVSQGEPARDMLGARLRAKYYGAQVITYRNLVLKIIELKSSSKGEQISHGFKTNIDAPILDKNIKQIEPETLEFVRTGIKALVYSTKAFYGLGDPGTTRLIVTNVWGTAHAQWGNVLTLLAAYMNPILSALVLEVVNKEELKDLLDKTMAFLALNSTPALTIDRRLLAYVGRQAGLLKKDMSAASSSFGSNTSDVPMSGQYQQ